MRALFALAAMLGTPVAVLLPQLTAQEFVRWQVWMAAEQQGPRWAAVHQAELRAAAHNGGLVQHREGRAFAAADFMPPDPWAPPLTPAQQAAAQEREFARLLQE